MSITSNAFGRVTLTGRDAKKFKAQVTYGRPKLAAVESVRKGIEMSRQFERNGGSVTLKLKRA